MVMPPTPKGGGMLRFNTPLEDYRNEYGLWVKREDLACPPPGPPFSKTRGVYARIKSRPEKLIGVLDTSHSQAGHAVARACQVLGKECLNFYPLYTHEKHADGSHLVRGPQLAAQALGAKLEALPAGRSCILYHAARKATEAREGYLMPNALKLGESVEETAKETACLRGSFLKTVLVPASSGTIAAGVIRGLGSAPTYLIHLGYSRSHDEVRRYLIAASGVAEAKIVLIDEGYAYKDVAREGETPPPWPCSPYYDLKAFRWWMTFGRLQYREALLWNIG